MFSVSGGIYFNGIHLYMLWNSWLCASFVGRTSQQLHEAQAHVECTYICCSFNIFVGYEKISWRGYASRKSLRATAICYMCWILFHTICGGDTMTCELPNTTQVNYSLAEDGGRPTVPFISQDSRSHTSYQDIQLQVTKSYWKSIKCDYY